MMVFGSGVDHLRVSLDDVFAAEKTWHSFTQEEWAALHEDLPGHKMAPLPWVPGHLAPWRCTNDPTHHISLDSYPPKCGECYYASNEIVEKRVRAEIERRHGNA